MKSARASRSPQSRSSAAAAALAGGSGIEELEQTLRELARAKRWSPAEPLPTTRALGKRYHVSNTTVHRLFTRLGEEGIIWRHANGRFFPKESRPLLERHKPYVCLLRKLQHWSGVYQGVMAGFSQAFGEDRTAMLFVHDRKLVQHDDTAHPPRHATAAEQRESLGEFFHVHPREFRGILLDEVWRDDVLRDFSAELGNAVVVGRPTELPALSSVAPDFNAAALLAIGHLYARGFDEIWLAIPFANATSVDLLAAAAERAATALARPIERRNVLSVATPAERERFIARLASSKRRVGVFCLEDNLSLVLREALAAAKIECPARVGLLSGMGTLLATSQRLSSLRIDYEAIGRAAGEILVHGQPAHRTIAPELFSGATT